MGQQDQGNNFTSKENERNEEKWEDINLEMFRKNENSTENGISTNTSGSKSNKTCSTKEKDTRSENLPKSRHLDRGWAWVIMISALMTHIMTFGLSYAMVGIFHVELLKEFRKTDSETAWTGSILLGTMLCSGPITSILVGKFGAQIVAITGGILSSAGLCLSALAPSLGYLYFTFGVVTGFGFGLSYLPCIVMIGRFFERRRSVATGFVVAGSGMGTFIFAPVVQIVVESFGWRKALIFLGGLEAILCLCGATYYKKWIPERPTPEEYLKHLKDLEKSELELDDDDEAFKVDSLLSFASFLPVGSASRAASRGASQNVSAMSLTGNRFVSHRAATNKNGHPAEIQVALVGDENESDDDTLRMRNSDTDTLRMRNVNDTDAEIATMCTLDDTRTLTEIMPYTAAMEIFPNRFPSSSTLQVTESIKTDSRLGIFSRCFIKVRRLLSNKFLMIFAASNFILCIGYQLPYVFFKAFALRLDVAEDQWSFILSVMGITDMLGRIFVGFVFDRILGKHRRMFGYITSCTLAGLLLFLVPFASGYLSLAVIASLYALVAGSTDSLTPALLVAFVGLDTLGYSFGLVIEMQGAGFLVGPPIAGALYGVFDNYDVVFYAGGLAFVLAGCIMFLEPIVNKRVDLTRCKRNNNEN